MTTSVMPATGRKFSILIASDRETFTRSLAESVRLQGHQIQVQEDVVGIAQALAVPGLDAVVLDTDLPGVAWDQLRAALTPDRPSVPEPMDAVERRHIAATLRFTRGNRRNAAQLLGIARSTLLAKIRKFGLDHEEPAR
jgi:DNA-binding NtrC family response regulator